MGRDGNPQVFVGSGYPNPFDLRVGIEAMTDVFGSEPRIYGVERPDSPPWMLADPKEVYKAYQERLNHKGLVRPYVFSAGGGTGAARVTRHFSMRHKPKEIPSAVVCGSSDGFVYPLMAWLWGLDAYYTLNVAEGLTPHEMEAVLEHDGHLCSDTYSSVIASGYDPLGSDYRVLPVCAGVLRQCSQRVLDALGARLKEEPYLLLLEDNYPSSPMGLIPFYEDVTGLWDVIHSVAAGDGAIGVCSISEHLGISPMGILRNTLEHMNCPETPVFYGVNFGHRDGPLSVIKFGSKWCLSYSEEAGLLVTVE